MKVLSKHKGCRILKYQLLQRKRYQLNLFFANDKIYASYKACFVDDICAMGVPMSRCMPLGCPVSAADLELGQGVWGYEHTKPILQNCVAVCKINCSSLFPAMDAARDSWAMTT